MQPVIRFATLVIGLIGAIDLLILVVLVSLYESVERLTGADPNSHGFIGLGLFALALVGSFLALFVPRAGGILLIVAGVGFFFVVHWWALLASPQLVLGGALPFLVDQEPALAQEPRSSFEPPAPAH